MLLRTVPILGIGAALLATACGSGASTGSGGSPVQVVAAENFWGSIATQVGGSHAHVVSLITNPDTDPHAYEPTPQDARSVAQAQYVIVNGAGYDPWAPKLLAANPVQGRVVFDVGDFIGKKDGDNPHMWTSPDYVPRVIEKINTDLDALDAADASYFDQQTTQYKTVALKDYFDTIATIKKKYNGTPVGATESLFSYPAESLGLNLVTPYSYLKAISEGTDPSPADRAELDREIATKSIKVLVFNTQNSTKDVVALVNKAKAQNIPVTTITETLTPANLTFQDWQTKELKDLLAALGG